MTTKPIADHGASALRGIYRGDGCVDFRVSGGGAWSTVNPRVQPTSVAA